MQFLLTVGSNINIARDRKTKIHLHLTPIEMMKLSATAALLSVASAYPGEEFLHPTIHFSHSAVANGEESPM